MSHSSEATAVFPSWTIGLDLGDRQSQLCVVDAAGAVVEERAVATTPEALQRVFGARPAARVVMEVGTHSPWVSRQLTAAGHDVYVANPSAMYGARRRTKRNDRMDAAYLARLGRVDVELLHAIRHRSEQTQAHLAQLRARDQVVKTRTQLINHVRGAVKSVGHRLPTGSADAFAKQAAAHLPLALTDALAPLLTLIATLTTQIRAYDAQLDRIAKTTYPETQRLQQIAGVGPLTALAFVLLVEDPARFATSRQAAAYFGLVPKLDESSQSSPQLRITKRGDPMGRRYLVSAAQYILGPFGPPCDLRRFGEALMVRGGPNAKKRAVIAVARKLAVLLHALWRTNTTYEPLRHAA
jgi:transposase